jgi:uncharacterized protein
MIELNLYGWAVVALCSVMVGISKTGLPGMGILFVPLMAMVIPARQSTGMVLGILILADIFAVLYYRRICVWRHIIRLIPATLVGIIAGFFVMRIISDAQLKPIIGVIVVVMLAVNWWRNRKGEHIPTQWWFAEVMGFFAGFTTMLANAAGPVMIVYLLAMRLPKIEFVGTSAGFFFIINWIKVPFSMGLGLVSLSSVKLGFIMLPCVIVGLVLGIVALKKMPQKVFEIVIQVLALIAGVKLLF